MPKNYVQEILNIIRSDGSQTELAEKLTDYHEKDLADALEALTPAERKSLYPILGVDELAEIFAYLDDAEPYLKELSNNEAAKVISNMDSDDAADALDDLDDTDKNEIVNQLDRDSIEDVKMLLSYSEDEIGSKMTTNYICIKNDILRWMQTPADIYAQAYDYMFVVLLGTVVGVRNFDVLRIRLEDFSEWKKTVVNHLKIGFPMGFQMSVMCIGQLAMQAAVNAIGSAAIAGYTAATKVDQLSVLMNNAFGIALSS